MDILRLKELLDINALTFYYKYLRGTLPSYFYSFNITAQGENHSYNTRQSDQIWTNRTRTHFADNRLKIYLPPLINSVPTTLLKKLPPIVSMGSRPPSNDTILEIILIRALFRIVTYAKEHVNCSA